MRFAPEPGVHSTHRRSHHQSRVIYTESVGQQSVLGFPHVGVAVAREFCVQTVARLARFAVPDSVREHDKKFGRIERLIFSEQLAGEFGSNKLRATAGGSVHDENGIRDVSFRVFVDLTERSVMDPQFGQRFTGGEFEIANGIIAFGWGRIIGRDGHFR